jgi:hypothetical protein
MPPTGRTIESTGLSCRGGSRGQSRAKVAPLSVSLLCAVLAAAATLLNPAIAAAGPSRYVFEMCDSVLPGGGIDGVVYGAHPRPLFSSENTCGQSGGALILRQNEIAAGDGGDTTWAVPVSPPSGAALESVTITAAACGVPEASIWSLGWISPPANWPGSNCAEDVRSFRLVNKFQAFFIELQCVNWSPQESKCHAGPWIFAHYFATTVVDPSAPTLAEPKGSMLSDGVKRGGQEISVAAEDVGGGLSGFSVWVNGLEASQPKLLDCETATAHNPSVTGTVAAEAAPCPTKGDANWTIDTGAFPFRDGANAVRVCASDFATMSDPNTTCSIPQTVVVDNSCSESGVAGGEVLSAQFERSNAEQVTVGYGRPAVVTGKLANNAGDPIRGARLCVKMATIGVDAHAASIGSVATDAEGRYRYEVPPGPNREVTLGYRHDSLQIARDVRYYAHARPSLHVSDPRVRNDDRIRFWGELPGPQNAGRVVVLQAGTVGSKRWITFRKATTKARGLFRAAYHFTQTSRKTKYRFRAVVARQEGYPWVAGQSEAVEVLVTPHQ